MSVGVHTAQGLATAAQMRRGLSSSSAVTSPTELAMPASEKNAGEEGTMASEIQRLAESMGMKSAAAAMQNGAAGEIRLYKSGNVVFAVFRVDDTAIQNGYNWKSNIAQMPEGYRPFEEALMPAHYDGQDAHVAITVRPDGQVSVWCSQSQGGTIFFTGTYFVL